MYKIARFNIYFLILLALAVHLTALRSFRIFGACPDIALALVIFFGLFLGPSAGFETGIIAGLLIDLFALDFFGINALVYSVTGFAVGALNLKLYRESRLTQSLLVLVFTALAMLAHFKIASALSKGISWDNFEYLAGSVLPSSVYTAAVSVLVYPRLAAMFDLKEPEEFI